jgi:hypothetical protein
VFGEPFVNRLGIKFYEIKPDLTRHDFEDVLLGNLPELKQDGSNLGPLALACSPLLNAEGLVDFLASEFLEFDQNPAKPAALQLSGDTTFSAATTAAA